MCTIFLVPFLPGIPPFFPLPSLPPPPPPPPSPHSHAPTDLHRFCDCVGQPVQTDRDLRQCHNGGISWSQLLRALSTHVSALCLFCSDLQPYMYKSVRVSRYTPCACVHAQQSSINLDIVSLIPKLKWSGNETGIYCAPSVHYTNRRRSSVLCTIYSRQGST